MAVPRLVRAQHIEANGLQNGVWDADTVLVTGDVQVDGELKVQPGTKVLFNGFYHISVGGGTSFSALGKEGDSIVFSVVDTTGFHTIDSPKGGWNGFQVKGGLMELDYCVLEYGKAATFEDKEGGALRVDGGNVRINHSSLRNNYSYDRGGAIHAQDAQFQMSSSQVNYNTVVSDSGAYAMYGGGASFLRCNVFLNDMEFRGNNGPKCIGGALSLDSCQVDLHNSIFVDNTAINGGGLYIMRNNFTNSSLYNLIFCHNLAHHFAGGLAFADSSPRVYNILVTDNASENVNCNGVFFYQESRPQLTNCIIYKNYPRPDPDALPMDTAQMWVWTFDGFAPEFRNCLIEGGKDHITSGYFVQVFEDIIDGDPLFVDEEHRDFHLTENSRCRDAGNRYVPQDLFVGFDLDGLPRVAHSHIDIGPYEYSKAGVGDMAQDACAPRLVGNPLGSGSYVSLYLESPEMLGISLYSVDGRLVAEKPARQFGAGKVDLMLDDMVEHLTPGLYLVEVKGDNKQCLLKAVR